MRHAIGIDLGTTYSAVAYMNDEGHPEIVPNSEGKNTTPSVVMFPDTNGEEEPLVGEMAKRTAAAAPHDVAQFVKRQMGNPDHRFISSNGNSYSAEELSAVTWQGPSQYRNDFRFCQRMKALKCFVYHKI